MTTNNPSKYYPKSGGQFEPVGTGQFQPAKGGQLEPARGGQLQPDFAADPRNLTETTGFSSTDTWNTGYRFAQDLVDICNQFANINAPSTIPPGNTLINHPIKLKFEIYKDPNDPADKGVYFHRFSDWWDNVNNLPNPNSDYWYTHYKGSIWTPLVLKPLYTVHGDEVIDIFFLDNANPNDLGGMAAGFGTITNASYFGSDLYEGWNNNLQFHNDWAATMFHEVGHLLNLGHSYEFDFCDDTYESNTKCFEWPGTGIFDNNYMGYCNKVAGGAYTPQQLGRINYFLEANNPQYVRDELICKADVSQDITINSGENITWNSTKHLKGSIIIEPNAKLTVKCDLFFRELGYIKVKEKGQLVIDGGRLTSECDNKLWYGVYVLGDETKTQTHVHQGSVELKNSATIENAIIGIRTGDFYYDYSNLSWPSFAGKTGGIITASSSMFRNNRKAIEFNKYHNILPAPHNKEINNACTFKDCNFVNDDYLKSYNYTNPFQWSPDFVTAWDVQGVTFDGCTFEDNTSTSFTPDLIFKTTAFSSYGAKYFIKNCTFNNINAGVWAESALDPLDYVDITNSTFNNVQQNITSLNQFNDVIAGNTIINQPPANDNNLSGNIISSWGVYMKGSLKYKVHDNNISSNTPIGTIQKTGSLMLYANENNIGIVSSNGWTGNNIIAENIIKNQTVSIQTEDDNFDLHIGCNSHQSHQISWFVNPSSSLGNLNDQGTLNGDTRNIFIDGCIDDITENQIRSGLPLAFAYNDDITNSAKPNVDCITSNVSLNYTSISTPTNCNQYTPANSTNGTTDLDIDNISLVGLTPMQKQTLLFDVASSHSRKNEIGKLILTLETLNTYEAAKLLTALYYDLNNATKAEEWLNKINTNNVLVLDAIKLNTGKEYPTGAMTKDKLDFTVYYTTLINALKSNRDIYRLSTAELQDLQSIVAHDTRGGLMAKGLLTFINKLPHSMNHEIPLATYSRHSNSDPNAKFNPLICYPNPFDNTFTLVCNVANEDKGKFIISDMLGNKVYSFDIMPNTKELKIDTKNWNIGIFFGTLYTNNIKTKTFKLVKNQN